MREHDSRRHRFEHSLHGKCVRSLRKRSRDCGRKTFGVRFRRQQPIGPFVVDFHCSPARLVIELDGSHHELPEKRVADAERTRWLEQRGYCVIRFWNGEQENGEDDVRERIRKALRERGAAEPIR